MCYVLGRGGSRFGSFISLYFIMEGNASSWIKIADEPDELESEEPIIDVIERGIN